MVAFLMIVKHELSSRSLEARFADQNDAVQAALLNTAHEALGERIHIWGKRRQANGGDFRCLKDHPEFRAEQTGPIMKQIAVAV